MTLVLRYVLCRVFSERILFLQLRLLFSRPIIVKPGIKQLLLGFNHKGYTVFKTALFYLKFIVSFKEIFNEFEIYRWLFIV